MNSRECAVLQRLISDLDDTRVLYGKLVPLFIRPHLRFLVERIARAHAAIANDLVRQMGLTGGLKARRGGGAVAAVHAHVAGWIALANADVELGCLKRVVRREDRIIRLFRGALDDVKDLHQSLHRELRELERTVFRIDSLAREMETPSNAPRPPATPMHVSNEKG